MLHCHLASLISNRHCHFMSCVDFFGSSVHENFHRSSITNDFVFKQGRSLCLLILIDKANEDFTRQMMRMCLPFLTLILLVIKGKHAFKATNKVCNLHLSYMIDILFMQSARRASRKHADTVS